MKRVTDDLAVKVQQAIQGLEILEVARDLVVWDVFPVLGAAPRTMEANVGFFIGIGLTVPGTGDHVINYQGLTDPYDDEAVTRAVRGLYKVAEEDAARVSLAALKDANGHRPGNPGGGLIPPG